MTILDRLLSEVDADPARSRRLAIATALVAVLLAVGAVILPVARAHGDLSARIERERGRLELYRRLGDQAPAIEADRRRLMEGPAGAAAGGGFVAGATDALATAALQARLAALVQEQGLRLLSSEGLPAEADGDFRRHGARASLSGGMRGIRDLLHAIEAGAPALIVSNLSIRQYDAQGRAIEATIAVQGWRPAEVIPAPAAPAGGGHP